MGRSGPQAEALLEPLALLRGQSRARQTESEVVCEMRRINQRFGGAVGEASAGGCESPQSGQTGAGAERDEPLLPDVVVADVQLTQAAELRRVEQRLQA